MSIIRDGALTVTKMGEGNYESRQRRVSYYNNQKLVIYNDRNGKLRPEFFIFHFTNPPDPISLELKKKKKIIFVFRSDSCLYSIGL